MATKHLAKQLGFIRRSSKFSVTSKNGCSPKTKQFFQYLIVIDFESTCWKDAKHYGQEIIEFPAVLLNTSNGEIESEFRTYVQPQEHPVLSAFCTELTGIKQQQVDEGVPLKICLSQFSSWIRKIQEEKSIIFPSVMPAHATSEQRMCGFVTWSDWDLGVCLLYECKRKQIRKPEILNSWVDLRLTYKLFYNRKPKGLNGALQDLGIEFAGREHSGLDDSRNTAKLAWRMICDGCVMKITKSLDKVKPKMSSAHPPQELPAQNSNSDKKSGDQVSLTMIRNNKQTSESETSSICGQPSNRLNVQQSPGTKSLVKPSVRETFTPQTIINGLSVTLGNTNKHCFSNQTSLNTLQTGKQIGSFTSTPIESNSSGLGHVLISTTVSSVNDISGLDISYSSDCLSMLADWEDAAVIEDTQEEPIDKSTQPHDQVPLISMSTSETSVENYNGLNGKSVIFKPQITSVNSIVYKSPNTTIYNTNSKQPVSSCSTFKLPVALGNRSVNASVQQSLKSFFPKRKLSSVSFYSPPKKQPFTIHRDQRSVGNCSLPLTSNHSRSTKSSVLKSTTSTNGTIRSLKNSKFTAPLCNCGRRAKRLTVSAVGPNQGKGFYTCSVRKRNDENGKGCEYFKWEHTLIKEKAANSSVLFSTSGMSFNATDTSLVSTGPSASNRSFFGLRPSMRT
ncbi:ERI1 exoribonuclease 2 [Bombina bombina]|uniref:ERI1 exoribonuclease 2 n=1 Tax=Bombina bombina TaxID=8345 RepID=UPI00235A5FCB|nr:ERI1 exoribonuclease 2 [Bombina bombina]